MLYYNCFLSLVSTSENFKIFTFGSGCLGSLGHGNFENIKAPKEIESLRGIKPKTVYSNWGHSAILTEDNRVFIFGRADRMDMTISLLKYEDAFGNYLKKYNDYFGAKTVKHLYPEEYIFDTEKIVKLSLGTSCTAFITESGLVFGTGSNDFSQLAYKDKTLEIKDIRHIQGLNEPITDVSFGFHHAYALSSNGNVYGWGKNHRYQLCLSMKTQVQTDPVLIDEFFGYKIKQVVAGYSYGTALTEGGEVYTWGKFQNDSLNFNKLVYRDLRFPRKVDFSKPIKSIYSNMYINLYEDIEGQLYISGLQDGTTAHLLGVKSDGIQRMNQDPMAVEMSPFRRKTIKKLIVGYNDFYAITTSGEVYTWDWIEPPHIYSEVADLFVHDMACGFRTKTIIAETL